jgi:hypothetical protein
MKRKSYERNRRIIGQTQQPIMKGRMPKMSIQITKEKFDEYEKIRQEGRYNMFDPQARGLSSLSKAEWVQIITDYDKFYTAWVLDDELEKEDMKNEEKNNED